jgi:hypothetical protein
MYHSLTNQMNNINNNGSSNEWTWDEDKGFEDNLLLEYPKNNLNVLFPGWSIAEVEKHTQMIKEDRFELPTFPDNCISKDRASNDENKDPPLKNKIRKVFHWKEEEHRYILRLSFLPFCYFNASY